MIAKPFCVPGSCHRVALAVHDLDGALDQWRRVFGAGLMVDGIHDELDDSRMGIVWMGDVPFLALAAAGTDGVVGRWLARNGPGVQSLAWEVPDMWASENYIRQAGMAITGTHIEGRHFFMHPRDTFGLMLELTDDRLPGDPRNGGFPTGGGDGLVPVTRVAHVNAAVVEMAPVAELLHRVFGADLEPVEGGGPGEEVADVRIGDLTVRLVAPLDASSPWQEVVANGRGHAALGRAGRRPRPRADGAGDGGHPRGACRGGDAVARPRGHVRDPPAAGRRRVDLTRAAPGGRQPVTAGAAPKATRPWPSRIKA